MFLHIHAVVWHVTLFVWVHYYNYLLLTASFSCTVSYMQNDYYQRTSHQCVTSYAGSLAIVLCPSLCALIWLLYQSALNSWVLPEKWTPCPLVSLLCSTELLLWRCDFQSLHSSDNCVVMYHCGFYQATVCLSKTGISVETCLLLSQECLLGTALLL
jgi:hypothetical protein